jgi:hypothetical protein
VVLYLSDKGFTSDDYAVAGGTYIVEYGGASKFLVDTAE